MQSLEAPPTKTKTSTVHPAPMATKKKQQVPVVVEKKPPVPTVNRSKDPHSFVPKPNYHYRNKGEVTGKITELPFKGKAPLPSSLKKETVSTEKVEKRVQSKQEIAKNASLDKNKKI